jgi:5-(carboxyamino)imidazole ribonucleotide mutase
MPGEVPEVRVAVGMGGPRNAGLFAVQILALADEALAEKFATFKHKLTEKIASKNAAFQDQLKK